MIFGTVVLILITSNLGQYSLCIISPSSTTMRGWYFMIISTSCGIYNLLTFAAFLPAALCRFLVWYIIHCCSNIFAAVLCLLQFFVPCWLNIPYNFLPFGSILLTYNSWYYLHFVSWSLDLLQICPFTTIVPYYDDLLLLITTGYTCPWSLSLQLVEFLLMEAALFILLILIVPSG